MFSFLTEGAIPGLLHRYGAGLVFVVVFFESMGLPLPGESLVIAAAIYAGATHQIAPWLVVAAAASGAILGDNAGYGIGRWLGTKLLVRYGQHVGLTEQRMHFGRTLFARHGAKVVLFGRFVGVLRTFAALLAGANGMSWPRFLAANAAGGVLWASLYGFGAAALGKQATRLAGPIGIGLAVVAVAAIGCSVWLARREERRLTKAATGAGEGASGKALPG